MSPQSPCRRINVASGDRCCFRNVTDDADVYRNLQLVAARNSVATTFPAICLDLVEGTTVCNVRSDHVDDIAERVLPTVIRAIPALQQDIMVFNAGQVDFPLAVI